MTEPEATTSGGMQPRDLLEALLELASRAALEVRVLSPSSAGAGGPTSDLRPTQSGACRVGQRVWVVLAPDDPPLRQAQALAEALVRHRPAFLGETFLLPAVRSFVDRVSVG